MSRAANVSFIIKQVKINYCNAAYKIIGVNGAVSYRLWSNKILIFDFKNNRF